MLKHLKEQIVVVRILSLLKYDLVMRILCVSDQGFDVSSRRSEEKKEQVGARWGGDTQGDTIRWTIGILYGLSLEVIQYCTASTYSS